jgi:hypothetical protein
MRSSQATINDKATHSSNNTVYVDSRNEHYVNNKTNYIKNYTDSQNRSRDSQLRSLIEPSFTQKHGSKYNSRQKSSNTFVVNDGLQSQDYSR